MAYSVAKKYTFLNDMKPISKEGLQLLHDGTLVLAEVERNGIRVDIPYCEKKEKELLKEMEEFENKFKRSKLGKLWKGRYGKKFNPDSDTQISNILYEPKSKGGLGLKPLKTTAKGKHSTDAASLRATGIVEISILLEIKRRKKARDYLMCFLREQVDGYVHMFFNLHLVDTFRSSSDSPNIQNLPNHDEEMKEWVRRALIPRPGHHVLFVDFGGIEVKVSTCYHEDPNMIKYLLDPESDMHRDTAMDLFKIPDQDLVTSTIRYTAKNKFVFAEFYGDWWKSIASNIWDSIQNEDLELDNGVKLKDWMRKKGYKTLPQYELHVKKVEEIFWKKRFPTYAKWREEWIKKYNQEGYFDTLTGFRCSSPMGRNQAINYPVQGSAFHCLLLSMILVNRELKKRGLKSTCIVGQIHDEMILDVIAEERAEVLLMVNNIMCKEVPKIYTWVNVPLEVEAEMTPIDQAWVTKQVVQSCIDTECKGVAWRNKNKKFYCDSCKTTQ